MEKPENPDLAELAKWLRYYRDLGFTHIFRSPLQPSPLAETPVAVATAAAPTTEPEAYTIAMPPRTPKPAAVPPSGSDLFAAAAPRESLEKIREDLGDCQRCKLSQGRKTIVFGSGNPKAEIVFVGEGPGADEDEQGLP